MRGGGVERVRLTLIRGFLDRGYEVDLILTEAGGEFLELVPDGVHLEEFDCPRIRHAIPRLREYVKRRQPDAMIVALWPLTAATVLACTGLRERPRLVLSDHNNLHSQYSAGKPVWMSLRATLRMAYPKADALVAVSQGIAQDIAGWAGLPANRVTTIYNPTPEPVRSEWPKDETDRLWRGHTGPRIITTGRLKKQKNHELLLRAFAKIQNDNNAVLAILGEGELEDKLRETVVRLGLEESVIMPGFVVDPGPWYASADLFVLSSDYEGFGNVLVEALHFGLPIVSTDCKSGPSEILAGGKFGTLSATGDIEALAEAMETALVGEHDSTALKARAQMFSADAAIDAYERLAFPEVA
ncbi:glycosyltransferase [Pontixanthobacter aquaemixtae]